MSCTTLVKGAQNVTNKTSRMYLEERLNIVVYETNELRISL